MPQKKNFSGVDNFINPIAVKEMRQAVKGRTIIWAFLFFLVIQLVIIGAVLVLHENIQSDFNAGRNIFSALLGVLLAVCLLLLPAYVGLRISSERSDTNVDLFFITSLEPASIIWGKTLAALSVTVMFFSACLPFMTLTYLLRGLDVPSMLILLVLDFLIVVIGIQFGIFLGCLPGGLMSRIVRGLIGLGMLGFMLQMSLLISVSLLFSGVASSIGTWEFWRSAMTVGLILLLATGMIFVLSVTVITPKSANRSIGIRFYLVIVWLITACLAGVWSISIRDNRPAIVWLIAITLLFCVNLLVSISERLQWGPRVKRRIPGNPALRFFAFLFFSGASGGMVYSVILIIATLLLAYVFLNKGFFPFTLDGDAAHAFMVATGAGLYTVCYALTALTVRRLFFRSFHRPDITGAIVSLMITAGTVIPAVIGFLLRSNSLERLAPIWFIGNPFVLVWWKEMWSECLAFSGVWAACVTAITIPWLFRQFKAFRPALTMPADFSRTSGGTEK